MSLGLTYQSAFTDSISVPKALVLSTGFQSAREIQPTILLSMTDRQSLITKAVEFSKLSEGWLGAGTVAVTRAVTDRVVTIAKSLEYVEGLPNPELTPNENGTVSMEWESSWGEVFVEIGRTRINGFIRLGTQSAIHFQDWPDIPETFLLDVRDWLFPKTSVFSIALSGIVPAGYAG